MPETSFETYSPKDKKQKQSDGSIKEFLMKPTTLIIIVLVCVVLGMARQFGQIYKQIGSMSNQLGKDKSAGKILDAKFDTMQKDLKVIKINEQNLQDTTSGLEEKEKKLEQKAREERNEIDSIEHGKNGWWSDERAKELDKQEKKEDDDREERGMFAFIDDIFKTIDGLSEHDESPTQKKANGAEDPFGNFPDFPSFKTGPVEHPHKSMNDMFQNFA